jgi:acyl carrier protein
MDSSIKNTIKEFIRNNFLLGAETFAYSDDDSFLEKGIIDSTGVLELVTFIEETCGFKLQDEELVPENLDSVNKLAAFITRKTSGINEAKAG